jgi:NTP pyrophosphatase (non-canonical NTP hydrolase)
MNLNELVGNIRQWGEDRCITGPNAQGKLLAQLNKTQEELIETRDAAIHLERDMREFGKAPAAREMLMDGIGDTVVTLILAAELAGLTFEDCLRAAYGEIKHRKGKMVNGQFVKELPST